jgi:hypothetical protein
VDERATFEGIAGALNRIAGERPILFPVHPRTRKMMAQFGIQLSDRIWVGASEFLPLEQLGQAPYNDHEMDFC